MIIDECLIFWKKARFPMHDNLDCVKKLKKIYEEWRKLDKNKTRNTETQKVHENKVKEELENVFYIPLAEALNLIKIEKYNKFTEKYIYNLAINAYLLLAKN